MAKRKQTKASKPEQEPDPIPPALLPGYKTNFETLQTAQENGHLCLVSAIRKSDGQPVALVCAMNWDGEFYRPVPLAVMVEGNPYELFFDPTTDREEAPTCPST